METTERSAGKPIVIARGGASAEAPEHTIAAFEAALAEGADALALRVRVSKDGHPAVFGHATIEPTTDGRRPLASLTVRELKRLDAGGWKGPRFVGQRIQTLQEVIERFRDRTRFWIELPDDAAPKAASRSAPSPRSGSTRPWRAAWCSRPTQRRLAASGRSTPPSRSARSGGLDRSPRRFRGPARRRHCARRSRCSEWRTSR